MKARILAIWSSTTSFRDASAEVEVEAGRTIDYNNCTQVEAFCISDLASLYCLTYLTGGSTSGTSLILGDLNIREVTGGVEAPSLAFLKQRVLKIAPAIDVFTTYKSDQNYSSIERGI